MLSLIPLAFSKPLINNKNGIWIREKGEYEHAYNHKLALAIITYLQEKDVFTVADFGCGDGSYLKTLADFWIRS